ncbi:hypothetical protein MHYP_G00062500 [Metynnis hypsauchen]
MAGVQVLLGLLCLSSAQAEKLLVVPTDGSHWIGMKPVVEELGKRGHKVVVVIPEVSMTLGSSEHTVTIIYPAPFTKAQMFEIISQNLLTDLDKFWNFLRLLDVISLVSVRNCESLLFNKELVQKLKDWEFDAVLTNPFEPAGAIIAEYLSIPSIFMQGNLPCPIPVSYVPQRYMFYTDRVSFWQRTVNLMRNFQQPLACRYLYTQADKIASRFLQRETSMVEIMSHAALWLMHFDFAFEFPRPVMPNVVMIGGISAAKPKPLPTSPGLLWFPRDLWKAGSRFLVKMAGLQSLLCLFWLGSVQAGKLLVIPADGSHWTGMKPLVEELGRRGNQVVVVIPEESLSMGPSEHTTTLTFPVPYTKAEIQERMSSGMDYVVSIDMSLDPGGLLGSIFSMEMLKTLTVQNAESLLFNEELMKTLKDWDFDAILTDPYEPKGVIVGEFLNIPSIYIYVNHPCGAHFLTNQCPSPASYVPQRHTHYSDRMGFFRRTVNMVRALLQPLACRRMFSHADEIASRFLQRETSMMEIMSRAALSLMRFDFDWEFPRPVMPNMVMIGGFSVTKPKPLPQVSFRNDTAMI